MASSYTGLYLIMTRGEVTDVQVVDPGGNSMPLPLDEYIRRDVQPNYRDLPTQDEYICAKSLS